MPHAARIAFALSMLALTACQPGSMAMTDAPRDTAERDRRNPAPTQAFRITIRIDDAPGPFASVRAFAQYDVVNPECLPPPDDNPGGRSSPVPTDAAELTLARAPDGSYSGIVYADYMRDEDYHGRGVCRWELIQVQAQARATGAKTDTRFGPNIDAETILAEGSTKSWLVKTAYPAVESIPDYPELGETKRERFSNLTDDEIFSMTLDAVKVAR